jgi:hypothetical protein
MAGPGTELKKMFAWFEPAGGCVPCNQKAAMMDRYGIEWCRQNADTCASWVLENAKKRSSLVAIPGVSQVTREIARQFVLKACDRAEEAAKQASP